MTVPCAQHEQSQPAGDPLVIRLPRLVHGRDLPGLRQQLRHAVRSHVLIVLDCSQVQELSPAGQALLVAARRAAHHRGARLCLARPSPPMTAALRRTGLSHLLCDQP